MATLTLDTYTDVVTQIQRYAAALPTMRAAPSKPPESMNEFPFAVSVFRRGVFRINTAGVMACLPGVVATQIHVARREAAIDYSTLTPLGPLFAEILWQNPRLNNLVSTINEVRTRFVALEYGGAATIGWDVEIDLKLESSLT